MNIYYVVCSKAGTNPLNDGRSKTESCGGIKASWLFLLLVLAILFPNTSKFNLSSLILSFWYHINGVILVYQLKQIILFCFKTSVKVFEDPPTWLSNHLNCLTRWDCFPLRPVYIQSLIISAVQKHPLEFHVIVVTSLEDPSTWWSTHLNCLIWWEGFSLLPVYI